MYLDLREEQQAADYIAYIIDGNHHSYYDYTVSHAARNECAYKGRPARCIT